MEGVYIYNILKNKFKKIYVANCDYEVTYYRPCVYRSLCQLYVEIRENTKFLLEAHVQASMSKTEERMGASGGQKKYDLIHYHVCWIFELSG